jgi:hypothetical protein
MTTNPEDATTDPDATSVDPEVADVLRDLATSVALLPQVPPPEGEEQPEGSIALPFIEQDGRRYIPVFTTPEALQAVGADPATAVRIPIAQLAANWPSDDVWLAVNPVSEDALGIPPQARPGPADAHPARNGVSRSGKRPAAGGTRPEAAP